MMQPHETDTKKHAILEAAKEMAVERFTPAEIEQVQRKLVMHFGPGGKTSPDYIAQVLSDAGMRVVLSPKVAATESAYEEEFHDLLHFSTLEEAEMCLIRLDELWRKFRADGQRAEAARVLEVARLGRRRAEMIARNHRVDAHKREEKQEIVQWFRIWLETPDAFFDWLDVRKQSPEYLQRFGDRAAAPEE
jgi:hypothetical protein